jgi:hypothetical protein
MLAGYLFSQTFHSQKQKKVSGGSNLSLSFASNRETFATMHFDKEQHRKVRYDGQLYAVILEEFPEYPTALKDYPVVLHPVGNDWIVHISNPKVRQFLTVKKGLCTEVPADTKG